MPAILMSTRILRLADVDDWFVHSSVVFVELAAVVTELAKCQSTNSLVPAASQLI